MEQERKKADKIQSAIKSIILGTSSSQSGQEFFDLFVEHLAKALDVQYVYLTERRDDDPDNLHSLAGWTVDKLGENISYEILIVFMNELQNKARRPVIRSRVKARHQR